MIALKDIAYGWKIGIAAVLTGATIYVANNARIYIQQKDAVQVIMAIPERCLATQTGTNSDGSGIYAVAPPSYVRTWTTTNGLTGTNFAWVTQTVTNTISDYTDHAMMVDLDAKIVALCPYYADTNSVYDGTTNIVMLTFTGLLTSLNLGDHTNFTSIPCWTNNAGQTNATTNAATFGPWAWYNYVVAWQERYKVLNALKIPAWYVGQPNPQKVWVSWGRALNQYAGGWGNGYLKQWYEFPSTNIGLDHWGEMTSTGEMYYATEPTTMDISNEYFYTGQPPSQFSAGSIYTYTPGQRIWRVYLKTHKAYFSVGPFSSYAPHSVTVWATATNIPTYGEGFDTFGGNGAVGDFGVSVKIIDVTNSYNQYEISEIIGNNNQPAWCDNPYPLFYGSYSLGHTHTSSNWWWQSSFAYTNPVFFYCTNKYW